MKFLILITINFFLILNVFSQSSNLNEKKEKFFKLECTNTIKMRKNVQGFFLTEIKYNGKIVYPRIAKFKIIGVERKKIKVEVVEWGQGWTEKDIKSYEIDKNSLNRINKLNNKEIENKRKDDLSETLIKKMNFPQDYQYLLNKAKKVYLNSKGYWEAVFLDNIVMIYIPKGDFIMGNNYQSEDEEPEHKVYLSGYWISKHEISSTQFVIFNEKTNYILKDNDFFYRSNLPATNISWNDSVNFCNWLSKTTGLKFDLPTEAQWEKAASGNKGFRKYSWGNTEPEKSKQKLANFKGEDDGFKYLAPVKSFKNGSSQFGVINMSGNVSEWVRDWYDDNFYSRNINRNPKGPDTGEFKVIKGGSYIDFTFSIRVSARDKMLPNSKNCYIGFRIVLEN